MKQVQDHGIWKHIHDQMGMDALSSFYISKTAFQKRKFKKKPQNTFKILQVDLCNLINLLSLIKKSPH